MKKYECDGSGLVPVRAVTKKYFPRSMILANQALRNAIKKGLWRTFIVKTAYTFFFFFLILTMWLHVVFGDSKALGDVHMLKAQHGVFQSHTFKFSQSVMCALCYMSQGNIQRTINCCLYGTNTKRCFHLMFVCNVMFILFSCKETLLKLLRQMRCFQQSHSVWWLFASAFY